MNKRIVKTVAFLAIFAIEMVLACKYGFNGGKIMAMILCLIVAILSYFGIGERKR